MKKIEIFLQGEGLKDIHLVQVSPEGTMDDVLSEAKRLGAPAEGSLGAFLEDSEGVHPHDASIESAGIHHRSRVHCHRCRKVDVTVHFKEHTLTRASPPSMTVEKVKDWVDRELKKGERMKDIDAAEHALQLCGATDRPSEDTHIGTLVSYPDCRLCFDLVPKIRVEG